MVAAEVGQLFAGTTATVRSFQKPCPARHSWTGAEDALELIVQPRDGIKAVVSAVEGATKTLDLIIFRFDLKPLEKALKS